MGFSRYENVELPKINVISPEINVVLFFPQTVIKMVLINKLPKYRSAQLSYRIGLVQILSMAFRGV